MRKTIAGLLSVLVGFEPAALHAQSAATPAPPSGQQAVPKTPDGAEAAKSSGVNYDLLSSSIARLRRELKELPPSKSYTPLKLDFYVEVVAQAPPILLFTPEEVAPAGPVPWGPMTHQEFLDMVTPKEFRSQTLPIGSLIVLGIKQLFTLEKERAKRQKEAEQRKREQDEREKMRLTPPGPPK